MNTTAIQTFEGIKPIENLLKSNEALTRFADALGMENVQPYLASVMVLVMQKPELMRCEPESILFAALDAAMLRLSVAPQLGHAYLVPFKEFGLPKAQMIVGYKGMKHMAMRTGLYSVLNVAPVFEGEDVEVERLSGRVQFVGKVTDTGKIIKRVAYFEMIDGYSKALVMTTKEIHEHARKFSASYNHPSSPWKNPKFVGTMEMKTPFRLLMERDGYMNPFELKAAGREDGPTLAHPLTPIPDPSPHGGKGEEISPTPDPNENGEGSGKRKPEEVKEWLRSKAGELAMKNRSEADARQRALLMKFMDDCFAPDPMAAKKRCEVSKWLTGYATVERMPGVTVLAMLWWLARVNDGHAFLDGPARDEARAIWTELQTERE